MEIVEALQMLLDLFVFSYMQQDLAIAKSLGDTAGECRAHGNLGSAYFSQGSYKEALTAHRYQLVLAMKCKVSKNEISIETRTPLSIIR